MYVHILLHQGLKTLHIYSIRAQFSEIVIISDSQLANQIASLQNTDCQMRERVTPVVEYLR